MFKKIKDKRKQKTEEPVDLENPYLKMEAAPP